MKYVPFIESKIRWRYRWTRACHFKAARSTVAWSSEMIISDAIIWIMRDAPLQGNTYGVQPGQWITLEGCISFVLAFLLAAAAASHRASSKKKTIFDLRCMCTIIDPRAFKPLFITPIKWIMYLTNETVEALRITRRNFIRIIALFFLFGTTSFVIVK